MKIGIITYHRAENYGSVLQAYALSRYLSKMGHKVELIDFHTKKQDQMYTLFEPIKDVMSLIRNVYSALYYPKNKLKKYRFKKFVENILPIGKYELNEFSDLSILNKEYDYFICGSDQVWNTQCYDFNSAYLLDFVKNKEKCISYAPSIGTDSINYEYAHMFKNNLSKFHAISMREEKGAKCLENILKRKISVVPDPVLLLEEIEWNVLMNDTLPKEKYIFCYFIGNVDGMRSFAESLRKKTGYKLIVVNNSLRDISYKYSKMYSAGPQEFLTLLKNCEYVCTDSFHATVFSLIFHKKFWTFTGVGGSSTKSRIENILKKAHLEERMLNFEYDKKEDYLKEINYVQVDEYIKKYISIGKDYLKRSLEKL